MIIASIPSRLFLLYFTAYTLVPASCLISNFNVLEFLVLIPLWMQKYVKNEKRYRLINFICLLAVYKKIYRYMSSSQYEDSLVWKNEPYMGILVM